MVGGAPNTIGYRNGDVLASRYVVFGSHGQGVFSTVLRARDRTNGDQEVAVKVVRANDVMRKAGQREAEFLYKLQVRHCGWRPTVATR